MMQEEIVLLQKALSILLTLFALSMILLIYRDNNTYSIGIIQAFNHPTLDITRQGFTDQIDRSDLKNSRNIKIANLVIENGKLVFKDSKKPFTPKNINLILAISSQSLYELLQTNYNIPIIFLAVSDLDFIETNLLRNNKMITGISDITPIESQFKLLTKLLPSINKIGVIYNPEEKLSRLQINLIKKFSSNSGIQCIYEQVNTNELAVQAAKNLLGEIDALYIPSDKNF
jgi:putative ABC transport system substrate-binding protein